jgi:hypothetical protein
MAFAEEVRSHFDRDVSSIKRVAYCLAVATERHADREQEDGHGRHGPSSGKGPRGNNLNIWPLDWDAMLDAERAVWRATQAIRNDAARPRPASQMFKLLTNGP